MKKFRHLHLVGATGEIRTAQFDGRDHIVVPVVAMVEGVVWAVNSDVPEFVSAEELAETPQQWNGRHCFAGHPADGGTQVTANTPRTLEQSFGTLFDSVGSERILQTRRLEFNAWLDVKKAEQVGPKAKSVCERLLAGKRVEVSVGCYVEPNTTDGTFKGKEYHGEWRNIVSDHLAFLEEGELGACSIEAGCGAPRVAVRHLISADGIQREDETMAAPKKKKSLKERFMSLVNTLRVGEGVSDIDVRSAVDSALRAVEPGYMGIDCVYPDEGQVIYYVSPEDEWKMMRRGYTMGGDGKAELADDAVEVEPVTTYEPVTAAGAAPTKPCGCGTRTAKESDIMFTERIAKLLASKHNFIKNEAALKLLSDAELKGVEDGVIAAEASEKAAADKAVADKLAADAKAVADAAAAAASADPKAASTKVLTRAEILAADPSIAAIVAEHETRAAAEKKALVTSLKAASSVLTEEQLNARPIEELRTLAAFAKVETPAAVDFSGAGVPRVPAKEENYAPPSPYDAQLKALREKKAAVN